MIKTGTMLLLFGSKRSTSKNSNWCWVKCELDFESDQGETIMKMIIKFLIIVFISSCSQTDSIVSDGKLIYIEPFPFINPPTHFTMAYKQAALLIIPNSNDTLPILFDFKTSKGGDIKNILKMGNFYQFTLKQFPIEKNKPLETTKNDTIANLPKLVLIKPEDKVKAEKYWVVLKIE